MVVMFMGQKNGIEGFELAVEHLKIKIGTAVNQYFRSVNLHKRRASHSAVVRIGGTAHRAVATQLRNSCRGSGAEESDF